MIEHDITYKWAYGNTSLSLTRQIQGAVAGGLDVQVPNLSYALPASFSLLLSKALSIFLYSDQPVTLTSGGTNAVQQVAITGSPTGGTFTLTYGGNTTAAIPWNATAAQVQTALQALASVTANGCTVSGGPLPGTPVAVTFLGNLATQVVSLMTHTDSLTGGSTPAVAVTTTTAGVAPDTTKALIANVPLVWDSAGYFAQPFAADVSTLRTTNTSGTGANLHVRTLANQ